MTKKFLKQTGRRRGAAAGPAAPGTEDPAIARSSLKETLKDPVFEINRGQRGAPDQAECKHFEEQTTSITENARPTDINYPKFVNRLKSKTKKVKMYWEKANVMIPSVFKITYNSKEEARTILEFTDFSLKGMLVMGSLNRSGADPLNHSGAEPRDSLSNYHSPEDREDFNFNDDFLDLPLLN